jgi:hypothetical protein
MESHVCEKFCDFYKAGKKRSKCGSFDFLARNLTKTEIRRAAQGATRDLDFSTDTFIKSMVCDHCGFVADGCDFRAGVGKKPCGGYAIVEHLLKQTGRA